MAACLQSSYLPLNCPEILCRNRPDELIMVSAADFPLDSFRHSSEFEVSHLPEIPGGWTEIEQHIGGGRLRLTVPAVPDAFLESEAVLDKASESEAQEYIPYWQHLWPASQMMAVCVQKATWPKDASVLEIGAGIGLVGLAALSRGYQVTFSDYERDAVTLALHNSRRNGFSHVRGMILDWRRPARKRFDVILGCDLLYEHGHHDIILRLLENMLSRDGVCWIGEPGRGCAQPFPERAREYGFTVQVQNESGHPRQGIKVGEFALLQLRRANRQGCYGT